MSNSLADGRWQLPQDSAGNTVLPSDSQQLFVDSKNGNDKKNGSTPANAVQHIEAALPLADRKRGVTINLVAGSTFHAIPVPFSGASPMAPLAFVKYGSGPDPEIQPFQTQGFYANTKDNLAFIGIAFTPKGRDPSKPGYDKTKAQACCFAMRCHRILIEGCTVQFGNFGVVTESNEPDTGNMQSSDIVIRRNNVLNNYGIKSGYCSGFYAQVVNRILLEENVFYHNGWLGKQYGEVPTIFNHNCYVQWNCTGVVVRWNVIAEASSHGIQMRSGGECYENLFYNNPLHLSFGSVNGGSQMANANNVAIGNISRNVFIGGRDINGSPRGCAIDTTNTKDLLVEDNLIYNDKGNRNSALAAINFSINTAVVGHGITGLKFTGNLIRAWLRATNNDPRYHVGGNTPLSINGLVSQDTDWGGGIHAYPKLWTGNLDYKLASGPMPDHVNDSWIQGAAANGVPSVRDTVLSILTTAKVIASNVPPPDPPPDPPPAQTVDFTFKAVSLDGTVIDGDLQNGDEVPYGSGYFIVPSVSVDTVDLYLDDVKLRTEGTAPYSLTGDTGNQPQPMVIDPGDHTITAVGFKGGKELGRETVAIRIKDPAIPPATDSRIPEIKLRVSGMDAQLSVIESLTTNTTAKSAVGVVKGQVDAIQNLLK